MRVCVGREVFQQQHGVGPHVALGVELGRLGYAAEADDLGQYAREQAELVEQFESAAGSAFGENAGEFVADTLGADLVDVCCLAADAGDVEVEVQARGEADRKSTRL